MMDNEIDLTELTVGIVANYVSNNRIEPSAVTGLIAQVHASLANLGEATAVVEEPVERPTSAQVRRSISDAGLVSFIDGRTYQSLKRHLTSNGMTPAEYRDRYGLKPDYPMVSPAYAAKRSALAKSIGLGQKGRAARAAPKAKTARK